MLKKIFTELHSDRISTSETQSFGRPIGVATLETTDRIYHMVLADCKFEECEIVEAIDKSHSSVVPILNDRLSMSKLSTRWVLSLFTNYRKRNLDGVFGIAQLQSVRFLKMLQNRKRNMDSTLQIGDEAPRLV